MCFAHNGVHFFNISTSKSGPRLRCLVRFDFKMCFAPQRRALFRHLNFQKWSDPLVFCLFCHNGVHFFMSHLASWLRTRRFSEPTFRPSGATNHWKNTVNRDFPIFSRIYLFFLLILSLLTLLTSAFQLSILSEVSLLNFLRLFLFFMYAADSSSAFVFCAFSACSFCFRLCSKAQHSERTERAAGEWHEDLEAAGPHRPQEGTNKENQAFGSYMYIYI